jgi:hypothetical protein
MTGTNDNGNVIVNGYMYLIGGVNASNADIATVQFSKITASGGFTSPGSCANTWCTTASLPAVRDGFGTATANGYIYVVAGTTNASSSAAISTVFYAKVNANGTITNWKTTTSVPAARYMPSSVAYNGYLYMFGGHNTVATQQTSVYFAKLNADGSVGTWNTTKDLNVAQAYTAAVVANGYVYEVGGYSTGGVNNLTTVEYAKLNTDGTTGTWATTTALPSTRNGGNIGVINGYIYYYGGYTSATAFGNPTAATLYAPLNSDGTVGSWSCQGNASDCTGTTPVNNTAMPVAKAGFGRSATYANGYMYAVSGWDTAVTTSVYYTSTSRVQVNSSLDLVGSSGENIAEGGSGGSLTAGNTNIVGDLAVQGQATFSQGLSVADSLVVGGSALLQNTVNNSTAFQLQNASGVANMQVTTVNLVNNTTFESGTANVDNVVDGWAKKLGSETSIKIQASNAQFGTNSMELVTTTTAQQGAKSTINMLASTQYTLSFYAKVSTSTFATLTAGRSDTGASGGETNCTLNATTLTTTYARFSCTFTTGATMGASGTPYIYISKGADASVRTIYIDGVQLEAAAAATTYRESDIRFDGQITFKNSADSAAAFQVQNAAATVLLLADTANSKVQVGSSTTDATAIILVLDNYNQSSDPTGTNGAMYYNSSSHAFRCYLDGQWQDCGGLVSTNITVPGGNTIASTAAETAFNTTTVLPANYCQPGRVIRLTASGVWGNTGSPSILMKIKFGSTLLAQSSNASAGTGVSNQAWRLEFQITCTTTGVSGTNESHGVIFWFNSATSSADWSLVGNSTTFDTTAAQTLQMTAQWNASSASNTITLRQWIVEGFGP